MQLYAVLNYGLRICNLSTLKIVHFYYMNRIVFRTHFYHETRHSISFSIVHNQIKYHENTFLQDGDQYLQRHITRDQEDQDIQLFMFILYVRGIHDWFSSFVHINTSLWVIKAGMLSSAEIPLGCLNGVSSCNIQILERNVIL